MSDTKRNTPRVSPLMVIGALLALVLLAGIVVLVGLVWGERPQIPAPDAMDLLGNWILQALLFSSGVGIAVMAIVEATKPVVRTPFNRRNLNQWAPLQLSDQARYGGIHGALWHEAAFGFLDLPTERLTAQIQIAFESLLNSNVKEPQPPPTNVEEPLSPPTREAILAALLGTTPAAGSTPADDAIRSDLQNYLGRTDNGDVEQMIEARRRLSERMQRRLDALQISIESEWRRLLRIACVLLSGLVGASITVIATRGTATRTSQLAAVMLSAILGATFAHIARDIAATIERLRR